MNKIPVLSAIQIKNEAIPENTGHNRPWIVTVNTATGLQSFVVKLYDFKQVEDLHCVTNEIIGNILAREFDLKTPECALIDIPDELALTLPADMQQQFEQADERLKFGTYYLEGVASFVYNIDKKRLKERISLDTLYAYDNMICNQDRGTYKPNLLLDKEDAFLIDHEFCFKEDMMRADIDQTEFSPSCTKYHLSYPYLKSSKKKETFFDDFLFYLQGLRVSALKPYFLQLREEGFTDYSEPIIYRIEQIKQKSTTFVNQLRSSLQ
jgi:hypothetical protein